MRTESSRSTVSAVGASGLVSKDFRHAFGLLLLTSTALTLPTVAWADDLPVPERQTVVDGNRGGVENTHQAADGHSPGCGWTCYGRDGGPGANSASVGFRLNANAQIRPDYGFGVHAFTAGGNGGNGNDGDGDGGEGGHGGYVVIDDHASVVAAGSTLKFLGIPLVVGGVGIHAESRGGHGGRGDYHGATQDGGRGGDGGHAGNVFIESHSTITLNGDRGGDFDSRDGYADMFANVGIQGVAAGGNGGYGRREERGGHGGHGANIYITTGQSSRIFASTAGVFAFSQGGNGNDAEGWGHQAKPGGNGGEGRSIFITQNGESLGLGHAYGAGTQRVVRFAPAGGGFFYLTGPSGIFAQSQGGRGGRGGEAAFDSGRGGQGGRAGQVGITLNGKIEGFHTGITARSFGGDGGNAGQITFGTAAQGGAAGNGGHVNVTVNGSILDSGLGVVAWSKGGAAGASGETTFIGAGRSARVGGNGGYVVVEVGADGLVSAQSVGILALSEGGRGGHGGEGATIGGGGDGGLGGNAGDVTVHNRGRITDARDAGILAVSRGGGGGHGASGGWIGGGAGDGGAGGNGGGTVTVSNSGLIVGGGIRAQSIGGDGGDGAGAFGLVFALGGTGGKGGDGGRVRVDTAAGSLISTQFNERHGIVAQSIGGGGGNGGHAVAAGGSFQVAVGGRGGGGGDGDDVRVEHRGRIHVRGQDSRGIYAQSVGGGGGDGGFAVAVQVGGAGSLAIGGAGGRGGDGQAVDVVTHAGSTIRTDGLRSAGIHAQSIGGGGGNGALAVSAGLGGPLSLAFGGAGGDGGDGGRVAVASAGDILTHGADSGAIFAQSVGGGGGSGGLAVAVNVPLTPGIPFSAALAFGGSGGSGGNGGLVSAASSGNVWTLGDRSDALFAQSIGGGGGAGNGAIGVSGALSLSFGGSGGGGGAGGEVRVNQDRELVTFGARSRGLVAQSVGGGGGDGGYAFTWAGMGADTALAFSLGGRGGTGGRGGNLSVNVGQGSSETVPGMRSTIFTAGSQSNAVLVQSVGGGGGSGGRSIAISASSGGYSGAVSIGGSGGSGGHGGQVSLTADGHIETQGTRSDAFLIQSIGGGGGVAGDALGIAGGTGVSLGFSLGGSGGSASHGGAVSFRGGDLLFTLTRGQNARGIVTQSIGGGGGAGGNAVSVAGSVSPVPVTGSFALGGSGGGGGNGGRVDLDLGSSHVETHGAGSLGVVAQSIGGGGGAGGNATAGAISIGIPVDTQGNSAALAVSLALGGAGGQGGQGGVVDVNSDARLLTYGARASALVAQSIGGGGGEGGNTYGLSGAVGRGSLAIATSVGGTGGRGGDGGAVTLHSLGNSMITTVGDLASGVILQSIGGGGGIGGNAFSGAGSIGTGGASKGGLAISLTTAVGGRGGVGGVGGNVVYDMAGLIDTHGTRAHGVLAQSIGGGGGAGGASTSMALSGAIGSSGQGSPANDGLAYSVSLSIGGSGGAGNRGGDVTFTGRAGSGILTRGDQSYGVSLQSIGGGGGEGGDARAITFSGSLNPGNPGDPPAGGSDPDTPPGVDEQPRIPCTNPEDGKVVPTSCSLAISIGGSGGSGGVGGTVTGRFSGGIETQGDLAYAVVAQSIGGGGGAGGASASRTINGPNADGMAISIGGRGGSGNHGGMVDLSFAGSSRVLTTGHGSHGVFAQSVGGGGGIGGASGATSNADIVNLDDDIAPNPAIPQGGPGGGLTVGGFGGSAGDGGRVSVSIDAISGTGFSVSTLGNSAHGVFAQSIGGGGGTGGVAESDADMQFAIGGFGGAAGDGGVIDITHVGWIHTSGEGSHGLFAQSVGGGGGSGGDASGDDPALTEVLLEPTAFRAKLQIGGWGGARGDGGDITVRQTGGIFTLGDRAFGILAQSIGGGGGQMGAGDLTEVVGHIENSLAVDLTSAAGNGGDIDITLSDGAQIRTQGRGAHGIVAQSIGGGGGLIDTTDQSRVTINRDVRAGRSPLGLGEALSLRGGDVSVRIGAGSLVLTRGAGAYGVFAQSLASSLTVVSETGTRSEQILPGRHRGGSVDVVVEGHIRTYGEGAHGVYVEADTATGETASVTVADSGTVIANGAGSWGIYIVNHGTVADRRRMSSEHCVEDPQCDSGPDGETAGSAGSTRIHIAEGAFVSAAGEAEGGIFIDSRAASADIEIDGAVLVSAQNASGLSLAGGSGAGAGPLNLTLRNHMRGGGGSAAGISIDGGSDNLFRFSGSVSALSGVAIRTGAGNDHVQNSGLVVGDILLGSGQNRFENLAGGTFMAFGTIDLGGSLAAEGAAPQAGGKPRPVQTHLPDTVLQAASLPPVSDTGAGDLAWGVGIEWPAMAGEDGRASGLRLLGEAPDAESLVFRAATPVARAPIAAGTFVNAGTFLMGLSAPRYPLDLLAGDSFGNRDHVGNPLTNLYYGARVINTVALDGHFEQTASGHMLFDVAFGPYASDRVNLTGAASVAGTGEVTLTWLENAAPVTLFAAQGGGTDLGLDIADTLAVDYSIAADAAGIHLQIDTAFGLDTLTRNGQALGGHMDSALRAGDSSGIGRLAAFLGNMKSDQRGLYHAVMDQLDPQPHVAAMHTQLRAANSLADDLRACAPAAVAQADAACVWSRLETVSADRDGSAEAYSVEATSMRFSGGFEQALGQDWSLAAGVSYEQSSPSRIDGLRARSEHHGFGFGAGLRHRGSGGLTAGATLSGGWTWHETERAVSVFTSGIGRSAPQTRFARLEAQLGQVHRTGDVILAPEVTASVTALYHQGATESGLGGRGVAVLASDQLVADLNPRLTLGRVFHETEQALGTVEVTAGVRLSTEDRLALPIRFLGANPSADPAQIGTALDPLVYQLGARVRMIGSERAGLAISYQGEFGDETESQRAGIDFRWRF